jgi:hypothetical protein
LTCQLSSCAPATQQTVPVAAPPSPPAQQVKVLATRCEAVPSTVYGQEPVTFEIWGEGPAGADVAVELRDEREQSVLSQRSVVPGRVVVPDLQSGDFVLRVGDSVSCAVTVNRDMSRAGQDPADG